MLIENNFQHFYLQRSVQYKLSQTFTAVELKFTTKAVAKIACTFLFLKAFLAGYKDCDILGLKGHSVSEQTR